MADMLTVSEVESFPHHALPTGTAPFSSGFTGVPQPNANRPVPSRATLSQQGNNRGSHGRGSHSHRQQHPSGSASTNYHPIESYDNGFGNQPYDDPPMNRPAPAKRGRQQFGQSFADNQAINQQSLHGGTNQAINQQSLRGGTNQAINQQSLRGVTNQAINQQSLHGGTNQVINQQNAQRFAGLLNQGINRPPFGNVNAPTRHYGNDPYAPRGYPPQGQYRAPQRGPTGQPSQGRNGYQDDWQRGSGARKNPPGRPQPGEATAVAELGSQDARRSIRGGPVVACDGAEREYRAARATTVRSAPNRGGGYQRATKVEDQNQRERLTEELSKEKLECQFCYERIWSKQPTWGCEGCYNVFHLKCLRGWASTCMKESQDGTWRCMICQVILMEEPRQYLCFCRKQDNPEWNPAITPHSCGQVCGKGSAKGNAGLGCEHPCTCLCHPGPCPPCQRLVSKSCGCGKTQIQDQCASTSVHVCQSTCDKLLNCGNHRCQQPCHSGPCLECPVTVEKTCHCGREVRELSCLTSKTSLDFACDKVCGGKLNCGNHVCERLCHAGACLPCGRSPDLVKRCPCGKTLLEELGVPRRKSCLDVIAGCGEVCGRVLACGPGKSPHACEEVCHDGACPPCGKKTQVNCVCGSSSQVVSCASLTPEIRNWKCPKRCQKKMLCGRHKCENVCCDYEEHVCWKQCQKKLTCGLHQCEDPCGHPGGCRRCLNTSFEERTCRCGSTVQHPPIPCGAPLPECRYPCSLDHPCGHFATHACHGDAECPPCTFLCEKECFGGHERRRNIPCHVQGLSCGKDCMKALTCGVHFCKKKCHAGLCQPAGETKCSQLCTITVERKCGHPCNLPCHGATKCPPSPCKAVLDVTCECRLRKEKIACYQHEKLLKDYLKRQQAQEVGGLKLLKLDDLRYAMPIDVLECDEECRKVERNKSLASALNLEHNPDGDSTDATGVSSSLGPPVYGEPLKQAARENLRWASQMENSLISLVKTVRETGASRRHQLQPMKYEQRKFVHELAEFYGCQTQSLDQEPVRSVVLIGKPDAVTLPSAPLYQIIAAERPAKQTAKCPSSQSRAAMMAGAAGGAVERNAEKFSWPLEMPSVMVNSAGGGGSGGGGGWHASSSSAQGKNKSVPTVDYFEVTD